MTVQRQKIDGDEAKLSVVQTIILVPSRAISLASTRPAFHTASRKAQCLCQLSISCAPPATPPPPHAETPHVVAAKMSTNSARTPCHNTSARLSTVPTSASKSRQLSHLHAQLAQLTAHMSDLENLLRMTIVQAEGMRGLGGYAGGM